MNRLGRVLLGIVTVLLGIVALAGIVVVVLSSTNWGHERVRRIALSQLRNMVHGQVSVGKISGNLLTGLTAHDVSIRDSAGAPFLAAQELSARYALGALAQKHIWLTDVRVVRPLVVLDRQPGREWNYQSIFRRDTTPQAPSTGPGWGNWIKFENLTVVDGQLVVRSPWSPSDKLSAAARDSVVREALGGKSRLMIVRAANPAPDKAPYQKVVELRSVDATVPLLQLADPNEKNRLARVATLRMTALPFRPPAAVVTDMRGAFSFNNDSLWWRGIQATMPGSRVSGDGSYGISTGDMVLKLRGAPAALADLRWLYPRLPSDGRGTLDFALTWRGSNQDYLATNADVTTGAAHITGNFGLALTDTFALHDTNLRFSNLDTRVLEQLVPSLTVPRRGILSGRAAVNGGKHALRVDGDVAFSDARTGTSRVVALGEVGMLQGGGLQARNLRVDLRPLQVELAKALANAPAMAPISGVLTGSAIVNGSTRTQLVASGDIEHTDRGALSRLSGSTAVRMSGGTWLDVNVAARPVSLVEVGRFAPALGLRGSAVGPVRLTGALRDLAINADLRLPDGGRLVARGRADVASPEKGYDVAVGMTVVNLRTVIAKAPTTSLTLRATGKGRGFSPPTMRAAFAADFGISSWDSVAVDSGTVRVSIANGLADVQRLHLTGAHALIDVNGAFGLVASRSGALSYRVAVDSLAAFDRWLPHTGPDTGAVPPRPGVVARAVRRARADSSRVAQTTEVERLATGRAMPRLVVDTPKAVPVTVAGSLYAAGTLSGNIQRFDMRGRLKGEKIDVHGNSARRIISEYAWTNVRTPASTLAVGLQGDTVTAAGFAFDSVDARVSYHAASGVSGGSGRAELRVRQGDQREYGLKGDYVLNADRRELRLADLLLRFDTTTWTSTHPSTVRWRTAGVEVVDLELRNRATGRIYANGLLPTNGVANFDLAVDNFQVKDLFDLLETDVQLTGLVTVHGRVAGTAASPTFRGAFGIASGTYNGAVLPGLHGTFAYADRALASHVDALAQSGQEIVRADARLPVNLALSGVTGSRMLAGPLTVDVVGDSLPIDLISQFTDVVSDVHGRAAGQVSVRGTFDHPIVAGGVVLAHGTVKLTTTGMLLEDVAGTVRMARDTVYVDSLVGYAKGEVRVRGTLAVSNLRDPAFDVYLVSRNAEVLHNERGRVRADAGLRFTGPLSHAYLSGQVNVTQGVVYGPEASGRHVIGAGDPDLFNVVDTALMADRELFPTQSPLLQNLRAEVALGINRSTWVRTKDANVEIFTDYPIEIKVQQSAFVLTGTVGTDRGEYSFMGKRFLISRGSATFVGIPDLNPTLQITGEYQVQPANSPALNVQIVVGGTLRRPKLSLQSDAQPPRSQSELLSLLAFGRSAESLLEPGGGSSTSLATVGAPGDLVGFGAALAARRLTGVAVGVLADQAETQAGKALAVDQFNITPGDVPEVSGLAGPQTFTTFINSTRIEAGKYLNPRTFVGLQQYANYPGARIEYRTNTGWRYNAFLSPRVQLLDPTLASQPVTKFSSYGVFIIREWRF